MTRYRTRRHLPHFEVPEGVYHVTWRIQRDQLPMTSGERDITRAVLAHDAGSKCDLFAGVVMDDHVHVLFAPRRDTTSMKLVAAWKSISAHQICGAGARKAPFWQRESYQRLVRTPEGIKTCRAYILANPARRWGEGILYPWILPDERV